jgi:predicted regulator of Ras-like GTPase activity (Roadblock/LC7/MglB family)
MLSGPGTFRVPANAEESNTMTTQTNDIAAVVAAVMAAMNPATDTAETDRIAKREAKAKSVHSLASDATAEIEAVAVNMAKPGAGDTLYGARHAAVSAYGHVIRYAVEMNAVFGDGWPLLKRTDGGNAGATAEKVEAERKAFVALGKSRDLANPRVHWANARRHALIASGHASKGTIEPRAFKVRAIEMAEKAFIASLRDASTATDRKAGDMFGEIVRIYAGSQASARIAELTAKASEPRPGEEGYVHPSKRGKAKAKAPAKAKRSTRASK